MKDILEIICEFYDVTPSYIFRHGRELERVQLRQLFVEISHRLLSDISFPKISSFINDYTGHFYLHATHINSIKKVRNRYEIYSGFRAEYDEITRRVRENNFPKMVVREVDLLSMCAKTF